MAAVHPLVDRRWPSEFVPLMTHDAAVQKNSNSFGILFNLQEAMNELQRPGQAASTNPQISPTQPTSHEDITPLTRNKSNQAILHEEATDPSNHPDPSEANAKLCINLDKLNFSSDSEFLRNFTSGNNSPFSQIEGMLKEWNPSKNKSTKTVSVKEAWQYALSKVESVPCGSDYILFSFVYAELRCDQCLHQHSSPRIVIGDEDYLKRLRYGNDYMQYQFIVSFAYLVQHICHIEQKCVSKRGVSLDKVSTGNMPFLQVITYEKAVVIPSDLLTIPRLCKTVVSLFHSCDHYAIAH